MEMRNGFGGPAAAKLPEGMEKEVLAEAPRHSQGQPRPGDVVTVELEVAEGVTAAARSWVVGSGKPLVVSQLDVERCVCTMRVGERAAFRASGAEEPDAGATLRLLTLERPEDLLGDGSAWRLRLFEGTEREEAVPGLDLRIRFSWRAAPPRGLLEPPAEGAEGPAASNAGEERPEEATTTVLLAGDPLKRAAAAASREMADLQRTILRRLPGAVVVRGDEAPAAEPVLRISRAGGEVLLESTEGLEVEDARRRLEALLAPPGAPMPAAAAWSVAREALVTLEEGNCRCRAADWLRGYVGYRVLSGLRAGQRCLVRVAPVHAFGPEGLPDLDLPGDVELEYDLEVLQVISSEDVTAHLCWGREGVASKRTTRSGEGTSSPTEGCEARIRLRVTDGASGAELVAERELTLEVASGNVCAAVDEIVPTMKENEACEVHCADSSICADSTLGLELKDGAKVVFHLELLGFEKVDLQSLSASEKIAYSSKRKEVGTRFFQEGLQHPQQRAIWFRALKRYFQAAAVLGAAGSWPDEEKEAGLAQRRLCRLNTAACYLKLEAWQETARSCNLVLDEEPENTKALFRRGQALSELGDHSGAEQCAKAMLKSDPKSREAARLLAKAKQGLRADAEKRKGLMARMAQGIGDGGEAAAATGPPEAAGEGPAAGGPDGKGAGSREGPAATEEAQEPLAVSSPLWPWALAALAGTSLALVLAVRWHRQRGARP